MADYAKHAEPHGGVAAVVEADARAAAPKTSAEAKEMGRAEKEAASRTRAPGKYRDLLHSKTLTHRV